MSTGKAVPVRLLARGLAASLETTYYAAVIPRANIEGAQVQPCHSTDRFGVDLFLPERANSDDHSMDDERLPLKQRSCLPYARFGLLIGFR
jgi:hypothetical protein